MAHCSVITQWVGEGSWCSWLGKVNISSPQTLWITNEHLTVSPEPASTTALLHHPASGAGGTKKLSNVFCKLLQQKIHYEHLGLLKLRNIFLALAFLDAGASLGLSF